MGKGGSKKKLIMIIGGVVLLGGFGFGMFKLGGGGKKAGATDKPTVNSEIAADATGEAAKDGKKEGEAVSKPEGESKGEGEKKAEGGKEGTAAKATTKLDLTYNFDNKPFIFNLLDPSMRWLAQAEIRVEAKSANGLKKIEENAAPLRDATIMLLSSKTPTEVATPDGKQRTKQELRARYESILGPNVISDVFFYDFQYNKQ